MASNPFGLKPSEVYAKVAAELIAAWAGKDIAAPAQSSAETAQVHLMNWAFQPEGIAARFRAWADSSEFRHFRKYWQGNVFQGAEGWKEGQEAPSAAYQPTPAPVAPAVAPKPLTSSSIGRLQKLITAKAATAMEVLETLSSSGEEELLRRILTAQGHPQSAFDLSRKLRDLEYQKSEVDGQVEKDETLKVIKAEQATVTRRIEAEIESQRLAMDQEITRLRSEFDLQEARIKASREEIERGIKARKKVRTEEIYKGLRPGLLEEIVLTKAEVEEVRRLERQLLPDARQKATQIERSRSRVMFLVRDASTRAQRGLMRPGLTEDEALLLIDEIPDGAKIMEMAEDPDQGVQALVDFLKPSAKFQIEPPKAYEEAVPMIEAPKPAPTEEEDEFVEAEDLELANDD